MKKEKQKIFTKKRHLVALLVALLISSSAMTTLSAEVTTDVVADQNDASSDKGADKYKAPYRGTSISYRNEVTALSLSRDADLTHNPTYAMAWTFVPRWWIGDVFNTSLIIPISRELTESDWTTNSGETILGDIALNIGASNLYKIPVLDIGISAKVGLKVPSSKASQTRSLILGISPGLSLSRNFNVLEGINLSYGFTYTKNLHEYTTAGSLDSKIDGGCAGQGAACSFMNYGVRNVSWGILNMFALNVSFLKWLSVSGNVGVMHAFVYDQSTESDIPTADGTTFGDDEADTRYIMIYGLEIATQPMPALGIAIGAQTSNTQLGPDGTYNQPFFNRYTAIYLDLRLSIAGLVSQVTSSEE